MTQARYQPPPGCIQWAVYKVDHRTGQETSTGVRIKGPTYFEALSKAGRELGVVDLGTLKLYAEDSSRENRIRSKEYSPREVGNMDFEVKFYIRMTTSLNSEPKTLINFIREGVDEAMARSGLVADARVDITTIDVKEVNPLEKKGGK
jgi:hypothetical protein